MPVSMADLETWLRVEHEIKDTARRLCAGSCGDAVDGKTCRGCDAGSHKDWRRDAIGEMSRCALPADTPQDGGQE